MTRPLTLLQTELHEAFRCFDKNGQGYLIKEEFEMILKCGNFMSNDMKQMMRGKAETFFSKSDQLDFQSFLKLVCNK